MKSTKTWRIKIIMHIGYTCLFCFSYNRKSPLTRSHRILINNKIYVVDIQIHIIILMNHRIYVMEITKFTLLKCMRKTCCWYVQAIRNLMKLPEPFFSVTAIQRALLDIAAACITYKWPRNSINPFGRRYIDSVIKLSNTDLYFRHKTQNPHRP